VTTVVNKAGSKGATPEGAQDEQSAAAAVQAMFNTIAPRYDLLNHVLSANIDRLWWSTTARRFREVLRRPEAAVLDICCGTGDMTMALLKWRPVGARPVIAADFAREMLSRGARKFTGASASCCLRICSGSKIPPARSAFGLFPAHSASATSR